MSPHAALAWLNEVAPARWWMLVQWDHPVVGDPETVVVFGYNRSRASGGVHQG